MWAKTLSRPKLLYSTTSPYSGKISVWQRGKERTLEVGSYSQSVGLEAYDLEKRVWGRIVSGAAERISERPKSILILGLGGGTEAHLFAEKFPGVLIDGVEIDPAIIEVGRRFFGLDDVPNLRIITADAVDVCCRPRKYNLSALRYSLVVFDAYLGDDIPRGVAGEKTLRGIARLLSSGGVAIFNWLSKRQPGKFRAKLGSIFGSVEEVGVTYGWGLPPGNILFFCSDPSGVSARARDSASSDPSG